MTILNFPIDSDCLHGGVSEHHKHHHFNLKHTATSKRYTITDDNEHQQTSNANNNTAGSQAMNNDDLDNILNESLCEAGSDEEGHDELVNSDPEADQIPENNLATDIGPNALSRALPHSLH